jgi:hypothetical protein
VVHFSGDRFRSRQIGFRHGVLNGMALLLVAGVAIAAQFRVRPPARMAGESVLYAAMLAAPIIGYLGGLHYRSRTAWSLDRTLLVFTFAYILQFLFLLMQGTVSHAELPFSWLQSGIVAVLLTARGSPGEIGRRPPGAGPENM